MQQPPQMIPSMSFPPTNITTDQIQKCLDENKKLIIAILENQNLGKLAECAQYQAVLQKNLMYLAAIADSQPQPQAQAQVQAMSPQMATHPTMQQGAYYMQHPQAAMAMAQQPGMFSPKMPVQFSNPHQMQILQQQQMQQQYQQAIQGQMAMQAGGVSNSMQNLHPEAATVGVSNAGGPQPSAVTNDTRGGNKQDASEAAGTGSTENRGRLAGGDGSNGPEAK